MKQGHIGVTIDEKGTLRKLPKKDAAEFIRRVKAIAKLCAQHNKLFDKDRPCKGTERKVDALIKAANSFEKKAMKKLPKPEKKVSKKTRKAYPKRAPKKAVKKASKKPAKPSKLKKLARVFGMSAAKPLKKGNKK